MSEVYKLSKFDYPLTEDHVALYPPKERGNCKMVVVHRDTGKIEHKKFRDILNYFTDEDLILINNTKVIPARMWATKEKTGAKIEVFLLRELNSEQLVWDVLVDPARKIRVGNKLYFGDDEILVAEVIDNTTSRGRTIRFLYDGDPSGFTDYLFSFGETPLPKWIQQKRGLDPSDKERYQSIFAKEIGAVAAPSSSLHFTKEIMKRLEIKGAEFGEMTVHTGLGSFRTIDVEDLSKHRVDAEYVNIPEKLANKINKTKANGRKVCAVGTSIMRGLESSVTSTGEVKPYDGWTNLFIYPPFDFNVANCLLTNLHVPKSSLQIMVSSYAGYDLIMKAYEECMEKDYKFFVYGDCMLIL
ncbi:MAG: tRNA preQ1(34) S-adenosylmethionine ribosyltransferase-isomerase QueA [Chitinophagales bacterium]|nr:tRNA preQ1(34) S-adenosylmethionine ribosyltransferase-isomerase QueA [Chitinophagales bacterium]